MLQGSINQVNLLRSLKELIQRQENKQGLVDKAVHLDSIESSTRQQWSEGDVRNRYTTPDF